jgi:3-hydroxyacyl-[acyl-carrier-protein] dehydratase
MTDPDKQPTAAAQGEAMGALDIREVMAYLPHRYPMLLVDKVIEIIRNKSIVAVKNVTANEPFFQGHFPHYPVMPGVLILEALAQAAGLLVFKSNDLKPDGKTAYYFAGIDGARFKRPVLPGDTLHLHVSILRGARGLWKFSGEAKVDGAVVASAELMCAVRPLE